MIDLSRLSSSGKFSSGYARLRDDFPKAGTPQVSDRRRDYARPSPQKMREHLVRCIWFDQRLDAASLALDDGRRLKVVSQGRWNLAGGPDFNHADISVEGETFKGDVEIHIYASDWYKHNHNQDSAYNNTVLHVVMYNDRSIKSVKRFDGSDLPQLTMSRYLERPLAELQARMDVSDYPVSSAASRGLCESVIKGGSEGNEWTGAFLDLAGDWRMVEKSMRFESLLGVTEPEEALYSGVMEALGYPANKVPFRRLASLVQWEALQKQTLRPHERFSLVTGEAVLLGAAGLLPDESSCADAETRAYAAALHAEWEKAPTSIRSAAMNRSEWRFAGSRPQNYPYRRIAAMVSLCAAMGRKSLFVEIMRLLSDASLKPAEIRKGVEDLFNLADAAAEASGGEYWLIRNMFGGAKAGAPLRLFSETLVGTITVNILVPYYLAFARKTNDVGLEKNLHALYTAHPKLPPSSVTRFMQRRIFGVDSRAAVVGNARRQQALYQIFRDCCEHDDAHCETCTFLKALKSSD